MSDLSALYISEVITSHESSQQQSGITELNLSATNMKAKSGLFIGEALLANPTYPITRIKFKDVDLEENGLYRLLEAVNATKSILRVHIGVISDFGLRTMSELLRENTNLLRLEFQESKTHICLHFSDVAKPWTEAGKHAFCSMLKDHTELQTIIFKSPLCEGSEADPHTAFRQEIEFYTTKKLNEHKQTKRFEKRHHDCEPQSMFEEMLTLIESKSTLKKMPVRKFFNNTFGTILNDALFALKKKQSKEPDNLEIFTKKGSIKFVGLYLFENLPQNERDPDLYNSSDSHDEI